MARQVGSVRLKGTFNGICFYKREGVWLARQQSSLTRKRFFKDHCFAGSRKSAHLLKEASKLASELYELVPKKEKSRDLFRQLVGKIKLKMKNGHQKDVIKNWFILVYLKVKKTNKQVYSSLTRKLHCFNPKVSLFSSVKRIYILQLKSKGGKGKRLYCT